MGGRWLFCCYFVGCCFQDFFSMAHNIRVQLPSIFFSICLVSIPVVHPYCGMDTKNTKVKVSSPEKDTDFFDIVAGVLQGDTLAPYLFIICLNYMLWTSIDLMKENGFTLARSRQYLYLNIALYIYMCVCGEREREKDYLSNKEFNSKV